MSTIVKGGVRAFVRELTAEALLIGADYAEDNRVENAQQLRSLGMTMLGAPDVAARAAKRARTKASPRAVLRSYGRHYRARYAVGGLRAGWFTDARMAWCGLKPRERAYLEEVAGESTSGVDLRGMVLSLIRPEELEPMGFGPARADKDAAAEYDRVAITDRDGREVGALALWRVLVLLKRFPDAVWHWRGPDRPAVLTRGGEVVAVLMPMVRD